MKKTVQDGFEYVITHAMQLENGSMVSVEIKRPAVRGSHVLHRLLLAAQGDVGFQVSSRVAHGGGERVRKGIHGQAKIAR